MQVSLRYRTSSFIVLKAFGFARLAFSFCVKAGVMAFCNLKFINLAGGAVRALDQACTFARSPILLPLLGNANFNRQSSVEVFNEVQCLSWLKGAHMAEITKPTGEMKPTLGPDRPDQQCHGSDCAGSVPLAHVLSPVHHQEHRTGDVDGNCRRARALSFDRRLLRGDVEAVSRAGGKLVLLCGAGVSSRGRPRGATPGCPSSSWAGHRTSTTGSIRA